MNKVELIGNIGKGGIKFTELQNKKCVADFSLATNEIYHKGKDDEQKITDWHNVKAWNVTARDAAQQFEQGAFIKVTGKLKTDTWGEEGNKKRATYVLAHTIENAVLSKNDQNESEKKEQEQDQHS